MRGSISDEAAKGPDPPPNGAAREPGPVSPSEPAAPGPSSPPAPPPKRPPAVLACTSDCTVSATSCSLSTVSRGRPDFGAGMDGAAAITSGRPIATGADTG